MNRRRTGRSSRLVLALGLPLLVLGSVYAALAQPFVTPQAPATPLPAAPDPQHLRADVLALSENFYPRSFERPQTLRLAAAYIHDEFRKTGAQVSEQVFTVEDAEFRNVIARFGPDEGELLVIGAHYDTDANVARGQFRANGERPTPGADDNASGVAGLLELARLLVKAPPPRPVELVAYALEEMPNFATSNMGSAHHAAALKASGRPVDLMISLEMIGYFTNAESSQHYPVPGLGLIYPSQGNFIAIVGGLGDGPAVRRLKAAMRGATPLPVHSINGIRWIQGVDFSDHRSFWDAGFRALMVTDTAFFRNPHYHRATDTADTLDYERMAQVVPGRLCVCPGETLKLAAASPS
jgi:Zn-dependent M28 family amino/carboxypeptidase